MATAVTDELTAEAHSGVWPTSWQWSLLTAPLVALAILGAGMFVLKPDYVRVLFIDPMGAKMLVAAGGLLVVGAGLFLGGCVLTNALARGSQSAVATVVQVVLTVVWFVFFCAPTAYVLTVGPAAIQIQRNLQAQ